MPEMAPVLERLVADDVTLKRSPVPPAASTEGQNPLWYDLGRAFWNPEGDELVAWVPIWRDGPALAAADHPWRARVLTGELTADSWLPAPPAALLDGAWHASLVAVVIGAHDAHPGEVELHWALPDGSWRREAQSFEDLVEPRLRLAQMLVEALGTSLIETLSDLYDAVGGTGSSPSKEIGSG